MLCFSLSLPLQFSANCSYDQVSSFPPKRWLSYSKRGFRWVHVGSRAHKLSTNNLHSINPPIWKTSMVHKNTQHQNIHSDPDPNPDYTNKIDRKNHNGNDNNVDDDDDANWDYIRKKIKRGPRPIEGSLEHEMELPPHPLTEKEQALKDMLTFHLRFKAHYRKGHASQTIMALIAIFKLDLPVDTIVYFNQLSLKFAHMYTLAETQNDIAEDMMIEEEYIWLTYVNNIHEHELQFSKFFLQYCHKHGILNTMQFFGDHLAVGDVFVEDYQAVIRLAYVLEIPRHILDKVIYQKLLATSIAFYATTYGILPCVCPYPDSPKINAFRALELLANNARAIEASKEWQIKVGHLDPFVSRIKILTSNTFHKKHWRKTRQKTSYFHEKQKFFTTEMNSIVQVLRNPRFSELIPNISYKMEDSLEDLLHISCLLFIHCPNLITAECLTALHAIMTLKAYVGESSWEQMVSVYWRILLAAYAVSGFPKIVRREAETSLGAMIPDHNVNLDWTEVALRALNMEGLDSEEVDPEVLRTLSNRVKVIHACKEAKEKYPHLPFELAARAAPLIGFSGWCN